MAAVGVVLTALGALLAWRPEAEPEPEHEPTLLLDEVAEELGYSVPAHFSRFFRHRAGVPPSAYREEIEQARELAGQPGAQESAHRR